jgi:hypothetical protein
LVESKPVTRHCVGLGQSAPSSDTPGIDNLSRVQLDPLFAVVTMEPPPTATQVPVLTQETANKPGVPEGSESLANELMAVGEPLFELPGPVADVPAVEVVVVVVGWVVDVVLVAVVVDVVVAPELADTVPEVAATPSPELSAPTSTHEVAEMHDTALNPLVPIPDPPGRSVEVGSWLADAGLPVVGKDGPDETSWVDMTLRCVPPDEPWVAPYAPTPPPARRSAAIPSPHQLLRADRMLGRSLDEATALLGAFDLALSDPCARPYRADIWPPDFYGC